MRTHLTLILLLLVACPVASAAPRPTVRERVQETLAKTLELQAKAVAGDPKVVKSLILVAVEDGGFAPLKDREWGAVFPTLEQLKAYGLIRPAAMLYAPLEYRRVHVEGYDNLPLPAPLQFDKQDAAGLREMLKDPDPALRSLAIEALAALEQVEDIPRIAELMSDAAPGAPTLEPNQQSNAMYVHGSRAESASDPVYDRGWRAKSVGVYASRAVYYLTGWPRFYLSYPTRKEDFRSWWATHSNASSCLWYWQQRISHELRRVDAQYQGLHWTGNDATRAECGKKRQVVVDRLRAELRQQSPELEAKVLLLAGWEENPNGCTIPSSEIRLRLKPERLLELLEGKNRWPDVDWEWLEARLIQRIALHTKILRRTDVPRLKAVYEKNKNMDLLICISRLLPPAKASDLDNVDTRDGVLREGIRTSTDKNARGRFAAELVGVGLPDNWPLLKEAFFAEIDPYCCALNLREGVIEALGQQPLTKEKRQALVDLVTDERFRVLWTQPNTHMGDDRYREGAIASINAHAGRTLIDYTEEQNLTDPQKSEETLATVLAKARSLL